VVDSFFVSLYSDLASKAAHDFTSWFHNDPRSSPSIIPIADVNQSGFGVLETAGKVGSVEVDVKVGVEVCEAWSVCRMLAEVGLLPEARVRVVRFTIVFDLGTALAVLVCTSSLSVPRPFDLFVELWPVVP